MWKKPRFCKRWLQLYPAHLSGGFQAPTEINASAPQCSTGALWSMLRHGGSHLTVRKMLRMQARRVKNAEAFLNSDTDFQPLPEINIIFRIHLLTEVKGIPCQGIIHFFPNCIIILKNPVSTFARQVSKNLHICQKSLFSVLFAVKKSTFEFKNALAFLTRRVSHD